MIERFLPYTQGRPAVRARTTWPSRQATRRRSPASPRAAPNSLAELLRPARRGCPVSARPCRARAGTQGRGLTWAGRWRGWPTGRSAGIRYASSAWATSGDELREVSGGPACAQQAEIDNALTVLGDQVGATLTAPWSHTVLAAARLPGAAALPPPWARPSASRCRARTRWSHGGAWSRPGRGCCWDVR